MPQIEPAAARDLDSLCALLAAVDLPVEGLSEHLRTALVARDGEYARLHRVYEGEDVDADEARVAVSQS